MGLLCVWFLHRPQSLRGKLCAVFLYWFEECHSMRAMNTHTHTHTHTHRCVCVCASDTDSVVHTHTHTYRLPSRRPTWHRKLMFFYIGNYSWHTRSLPAPLLHDDYRRYSISLHNRASLYNKCFLNIYLYSCNAEAGCGRGCRSVCGSGRKLLIGCGSGRKLLIVYVPMTQGFIDSISYYGPSPCAVSSAPSCCIDLKNVAACVSWINTHTHTHTHTHRCVCVCMPLTLTVSCVCVCACVYTHTHTHTGCLHGVLHDIGNYFSFT